MKGVRDMIDLELLSIVMVGPTDEALLIQLLEKKDFGTDQIKRCLRRLLKDREIRVTSENCYAITASGKELLAFLFLGSLIPSGIMLAIYWWIYEEGSRNDFLTQVFFDVDKYSRWEIRGYCEEILVTILASAIFAAIFAVVLVAIDLLIGQSLDSVVHDFLTANYRE